MKSTKRLSRKLNETSEHSVDENKLYFAKLYVALKRVRIELVLTPELPEKRRYDFWAMYTLDKNMTVMSALISFKKRFGTTPKYVFLSRDRRELRLWHECIDQRHYDKSGPTKNKTTSHRT
jgi:hypothetical protein